MALTSYLHSPEVYTPVQNGPDGNPIWIHPLSNTELQPYWERLGHMSPESSPLHGLPFAIKDNIDLAGIPTTAACPAFSRIPQKSAFAVEKLIAAGAVPFGKTNLDQFATGLVGTRSPYGACHSIYSTEHISGGSSSGSALAVATRQVAFALGTDTAGSGRIPAAFNHLTGLKPTLGRISTRGVLPACRSLDCISIFTHLPSDALRVLHVMEGFDADEPFSRRKIHDLHTPGTFRFAVPYPHQWQFFGDQASESAYQKAIAQAVALGGTPVEFDFEPFAAMASLLYAGPWVAERLAAIEAFLEENPSDVHPVVRSIIESGKQFTAVDTFNAIYRQAALRRATEHVWNQADCLFLPSAPTHYTIAELLADPVTLNSRLGTYTNFVNLLDLAAVAVPVAFKTNGLPFSITLVGPAWSDETLVHYAEILVQGKKTALKSPPPGHVALAVVGAHLQGQPLNAQLTERGARLLGTTQTSPHYRLFALNGPGLPKPGLIHAPDFKGPGIEVEVWSLPTEKFGSFVAEVPPPLTIGNLILSDNSTVKGFLCEPFAVADAQDITHYRSWRNFRS